MPPNHPSVVKQAAAKHPFALPLRHLPFILFCTLTLTTPSWRYGPFTWLPLWQTADWAGGPITIGILNLLPLLALLSWATHWWQYRQWQWGPPFLTTPLFAFTLLGCIRLWGLPNRHLFIQGGAFLLAWFVYLYILNQRPPLLLLLLTVITLQSSVGISQFILQSDLGLTLFGELPLNPAFEGVSVIAARGNHWLRAYGLTAHPNLLGAILTAMLLWLWSHILNRRHLLLIILFNLGFLGLLVSFSRSAWLAFAVGFLFMTGIKRLLNWRWLLLLLLPTALFLLLFGDLVLNRFMQLDSFVEAQSLNERWASIQTAISIISQHPLTGVGLGYYWDYIRAQAISTVRVHNVFLLMTAELGLLGGFGWLWLTAAPFWHAWQHQHPTRAQLAPWLAALVISFFDTTLWLTANWQTAVLFALLMAHLLPTKPAVVHPPDS